MKNVVFFILAAAIFASCSKQETATRTEHYRKVTYRVTSGDSNLFVRFKRGVYDEVAKGNVRIDTTFPAPGTFLIPTTVLNEEIEIFGESYVSGNFDLEILGEDNKVLAKTDTIPLDPANQLHPDHWYITIKAKP